MKELGELYREVFQRTHGFMLNWPLDRGMRIGDFFTMRNQHLGVLGNIYEPYFHLNVGDVFLLDKFKFNTPVLEPYTNEQKSECWQHFKPEPWLWNLSSGCTANYSGARFDKKHKDNILPPDYNALEINFQKSGGFLFTTDEVEYLRMPHFADIHKEVVRRLTSEFYDFNSIYLVTEVALAKECTVAVAENAGATVTLSLENYFNSNLIEFMNSKEPFKVERVDGMSVAKFRAPGAAFAFKAQKMQLSASARGQLIDNIYNTSDPNFQKYAVELINNGLFHLFPKIEINPGNATDFFEWAAMSMQDVNSLTTEVGG